MPQYVEGPEAKGMESGFALDELLRRERGQNARAVFGEVANRSQQQERLGAQRADAEQAQKYAIERMVKGEELKEQGAQREAERSAPFLQAMIGGNPETAKAMGFTTPVPEQLPVPEAGYPGAPATVAPRQPTLQEAAGAARAVPGMAQALLQHQIGANKPMVVGPEATLVSPEGKVLFQGPQKPKMGYESYDDALLAVMRQTRLNDISGLPKMRPTIDQGSQGWEVKWAPAEPMTPQDPLKLQYDLDVKMGMPQPQALEKYIQSASRLAGQRTFQSQLNTPYTEEAKKRMETTNMAIQSAYRLQSYTRADREKFTGAGKIGYEAARYAQELGLPSPGYTPEDVQRYSNFVKDNGMIEQFKFAVGGKQLTQGEQRVVEAFIPTGREFTTAQYEAKLKGIVAAMEASQAVDMWLSTSSKPDITPDSIRAMYKQELLKRGIDVEAPAKEQTQAQMPSGQRLRDKYLKPGE